MTERERRELRHRIDARKRERRALRDAERSRSIPPVADDDLTGEVRRYGRRRFVFRELSEQGSRQTGSLPVQAQLSGACPSCSLNSTRPGRVV